MDIPLHLNLKLFLMLGISVLIVTLYCRDFIFINNTTTILFDMSVGDDSDDCTSDHLRPFSVSELNYNKAGSALYKKKHINPPTYIPRYSKRKLKTVIRTIKSSNAAKGKPKPEVLQLISEIVQEQLTTLQDQIDCDQLNFICGYKDVCGLGCQIHQRISCLMMSYALGIPVIHEEKGWGYNDTWRDVFVPFGSKCSPGNQTYRFFRQGILYREVNGELIKTDLIENPIRNGIPVVKELAEIVELCHPNPFLWWVGQFVKFGLQLNEQLQKSIEKALLQLEFQHPIVGVHIRRTDKNSVESKRTRHEIADYMKKVEKYYQKLNGTSNISVNNVMKNVFIASDDATILNETRKQYTPAKYWNIVGFDGRQTFASDVSRHGALKEIVIDLFLLYQCDFVVCGYSSNVCGVLLEMFSSKYFDGVERVDGYLDGYYSYNRYMPRRMATKIIKVCSSGSNVLLDHF